MATHTAKRALIITACALLPFAAACGSDDAPTPSSSSSSTSSTSKSSPSSSKPAESSTESESSSSTARPNPTREQTTDSAPAPSGGASTSARPTGYTDAPGQAAPSEMNKTVASCGDPSLHETGTTFFTDGSSGWTQQCANQMMAQQPAAAPEPAPAAPAPAPEQQSNYVTPGAFCSGGTGVSKNGVPMVCTAGADGENRWRAQ